MPISRFLLTGLSAATAAIFASTAAIADMGLSPAKPGDVYVSIDGGYLLQDGLDVNGYGISTTPGSVTEAYLSAQDGWFAGIMIGWEKGSPLVSFLPFTRIEGYVFGGETSGDRSDSAPPLADITIKSVDGSVNVIGGSSALANTERRTVEFGYRSEFDQILDPSRTLTWSLVSFFRNSEEDTDVLCSNACGIHRSANVDTWMFGNMLVVEPEFKITSGIAVIGRAGLGFYSYDSTGTFRSFSSSGLSPDPFKAAVEDDDDGFGFRGSLGAGLKFTLSSNTRLETFAEADYFSDAGVAQFSNSNPTDGTPSSVANEDLWELRAGARLTISFGNGQ